ncbi:U3 snoRNP protein [Coemansia sp. RSA 2050]|nr:U3 snoRNP protein [Coemansia sp. RSA 2050]KAJ2732283.1 U3 snoRNP protein [Coemansia sp. BCRC 34962]
MATLKTKREAPINKDTLSSDEDRVERPAPKAKRSRRGPAKSRAEVDLERLVFGGGDERDLGNDIFSKIGQETSAFMESGSEASDSETDADAEIDSASDEEDVNNDEEEEEDGDEPSKDDSLFFVDTVRDEEMVHSESDTDAEEGSDSDEEVLAQDGESTGPKAAWVDDDMQSAQVALKAQSRSRKLRETQSDNLVSGDIYEERLRQQFQKIHAVPQWAADAQASHHGQGEDGDSIGGELLKTTISLLSKSSSVLQPTRIDAVRVRNANHMAPSQSAVLSIQFHPTSNVLLTAGLDKTLRLFEVDGKENHKIQSIYFKDLPVTTAQFIRSGQEIVVSGRRGYYYSVDVGQGSVNRINGIPGHKMPSLEFMRGNINGDRLAVMSNGGQIHLLSARTKQFIHTLPMNGVVRDISFTADGNYLWSTGLDNEVYQWDLRQNRCLSRWHDSTAFRPTCLGLSQDGSYYASGDNSGVVNIYDTNSVVASQAASDSSMFNVKPFKSVNNLTTSIRGVKFNHSSEILGIFSRHKADQLKLVHLPTGTVFANWPSMSSHLGNVQCIDFSPQSGFMAVGNDSGKALLYRLPHYQGY